MKLRLRKSILAWLVILLILSVPFVVNSQNQFFHLGLVLFRDGRVILEDAKIDEGSPYSWPQHDTNYLLVGYDREGNRLLTREFTVTFLLSLQPGGVETINKEFRHLRLPYEESLEEIIVAKDNKEIFRTNLRERICADKRIEGYCPETTEPDYLGFHKRSRTITGRGPNLVIPSRIDGVQVEVIGKDAFRKNDLLSVDIGDNVKVIGERAFSNNTLVSVEIPDTVEVIGEYAFAHNNLVTVEIPNGVEVIGENAFRNNDLVRAEIGDSVEVIDKYAFRGNHLFEVGMPESLEVIGKAAFYGNDLTSVEIPDGVEEIGISAFSSNILETVDIGDDVKVIGNSAFYDNNLTSVEIPNGVEEIRTAAFKSNELTTVEMPGSVKTIGKRAFIDNNLSSVKIGDNVEEIGEKAFKDNELISVKVPGNVDTASEHIIEGNFKEVYEDNDRSAGVYVREDTDSEWYYDGSIPPKEELEATHPDYFEFDAGSGTIKGYEVEGGLEVTIPSQIYGVDVKAIGGWAFYDKDLVSVEIPAGVEEIRRAAFRSNNLNTVVIPDGVEVIGKAAFADNNLTSVEIPEGIDVDRYAITGNFKEVYLDNNKAAGVYLRDDVDNDWYKD